VRFIATWKTAEIENEKRRQMELRAAAARGAAEQAGEDGGGSNRVVGKKNTVRSRRCGVHNLSTDNSATRL